MSQPTEPLNAPEAVAAAVRAAMEQVPFARWLGLALTSIEGDRVSMSFATRDEFVGNPIKAALHGGVISAALDTVGGFAALLGVLAQSPQAEAAAAPWLSTIDLRTDFLRPGIGREYLASAFPLRVGNRLVVTRMELHGEEGHLIAVGTGTYVVP